MSNDNTPKTQSQVTVSPTAEGESPASPETSKRRWALRRKKNSYASSLRPITQEEIDSLPAALSSQQKVEKAAAEQARLAVASTKPKPWVEVLYLLLGKNGKSDAPAEKPSMRDFSNRDFRGFALYGKDLSKTNFTNANFRGVDLTEADLNGSDLRNAQLQHSILEDAVLTDVKNLTLRQVGGANLQNIQPPTAVTIDASAQVDKALENAGKLYLTTISLCIFSVLVVLATTDIEIVAGTGKTTLPLVNLQIPTGWFFFITPLLITITHLTLHLHLLRAWEAMLDLPAIYPDGRTVDRKVNPLLLNSIVLLHWPRLRGELPPFTFTQAQLSKLTLYWADSHRSLYVLGTLSRQAIHRHRRMASCIAVPDDFERAHPASALVLLSARPLAMGNPIFRLESLAGASCRACSSASFIRGLLHGNVLTVF